MSEQKKKPAAVVTIHAAGEMTPAERADIAAWLRKTASDLAKEGANYAKRFTARYLYRAAALLALLVLPLTSACVIKQTTDVDTAQGITSPSQMPTPTPGAPCELGSLRPGTTRDVREIAQGATVAIGVELLGVQGLPLASSCLGQFSPVWTGGAPCVVSGAGYDAALSAPASAPLDAVCSPTVTVGGKSGSVPLRVVAP